MSEESGLKYRYLDESVKSINSDLMKIPILIFVIIVFSIPIIKDIDTIINGSYVIAEYDKDKNTYICSFTEEEMEEFVGVPGRIIEGGYMGREFVPDSYFNSGNVYVSPNKKYYADITIRSSIFQKLLIYKPDSIRLYYSPSKGETPLDSRFLNNLYLFSIVEIMLIIALVIIVRHVIRLNKEMKGLGRG